MSFHASARAPGWPGARRVGGQALGGTLVAFAAAALTAYLISHNALKGVAVVIVFAGSLWFLATRRTELALALLMLYLGLLDGYLKLATGSSYVTFVRDVLLYAIAIGVLLRATTEGKRLLLPPLGAWVVAFVIIVLIQIANPDGGTIYHSLAGARQNLEFVPLFFLTYAFVRTIKALRGFVILLLILAAANGAANIVQFRESPQQLASWGPGYAERVLGLNGFGLSGRTFFNQQGQNLTRPFGLGSDAGDGGLMDAFALGSVLALFSIPATRRYAVFVALAAALAVAGVFTAQGRAVVVCAIVVLLAYALLGATSRRAVTTLGAVLAVAAVGFLAASVITGSSQSPTLRSATLSPTNLFSSVSSNRGGSLASIPRYFVHYPLGAGLGVAGPAVGTAGAPPLAGVLDAENEVSFAMIETGIPGMIALVGFTLAVFVLGVRRCRHEPDPEARLLLAAIIAPIAGMLALYAVSAVTPTTPGGPYLWAVGGVASYWLIGRPATLRREAGAALATT